jgi:hypothetical protein
MKKTVLILGVVALLSFAADKYVTIKLSQQQLNYHWRNLEGVKKIIDESSLPHTQVKFVINAIDSLQKDISKNAKLDSAAIVLPLKK